MAIKLIKSTFYREEATKKKLANFIINSKKLSLDKECQKFEKSFAKKQQRKYAVFTSSGSGANIVLIQALLNLGILEKSDKIGFSTVTWSTNIMPIIELGLNPVAIDCSLNTLNISPENLEKYLKKIRCLFLTNVLGFCDRIDEIRQICQKNRIVFIEDNCESLGSKINGKLLGNFGLASTFSFYVGHHLSTLEGGMICTDNKELYEMLVIVRAHGWDRNLPEELQKTIRRKYQVDDFYGQYTFYDLGYNFRPTEINGFIGNIQIQYWDEIVEKRFDNYKLFDRLINENDDFIPLKMQHMDLVSNFAMPIICKDKKTFDKYSKKFTKNQVEIRPIIAGNMTRQPFYKKYLKDNEIYKNADFIHQNAFYFANNPELTKNEINVLCQLLKKD